MLFLVAETLSSISRKICEMLWLKINVIETINVL